MIDFRRLFIQYGVPFFTEGKNTVPGRISVRCPFCDDSSNHGSFSYAHGDYVCWRCKGGSPHKALSLLLGLSLSDAALALREYQHGKAAPLQGRARKVANPDIHAVQPPGGPLLEPHKRYLRKRGLDPDRLVSLYGITGTGPADTWKGLDYRLRIIIPVKDINGRVVSFQGRDITGQQELRYKGCPVERSAVHYKHIVYGSDVAREYSSIVVVEGIFDAWKLGPGAVATFGTSLTQEQIWYLSQWPRVTFLFDPEPEAQQHAQDYARELALQGTEVFVASADFGRTPSGEIRDPGDLTLDEARKVMIELSK